MVEEVSVKYKGKVNVIGLLCDALKSDGSVEASKVLLAWELLDNAGANFTNILLSQSIASSMMNEISVTPTTFFVDNEGRMKGKIYTGSRSLSAWSNIIDEIL